MINFDLECDEGSPLWDSPLYSGLLVAPSREWRDTVGSKNHQKNIIPMNEYCFYGLLIFLMTSLKDY